MRVGLVRSAAFGMVALVGLGLVGCDDDPTDFGSDETVKIFTNPSVMTINAGATTLLSSRTQNEGNEPTWEEVTASVDATCGNATVVIETAETYEPSIQPPGQFDITGGSVLGSTCITLTGGGAEATVEVTVVGDSLDVTAASETIAFEATTQMSAALIDEGGSGVGPFDPGTDVVWSSDDESILTVDETGLVTGVGVGAATITGSWTDGGVTRSGSVSITVNPPVTPTITSLDVTSGPVGTYVTITGTDFVSITSLFIDGLDQSLFQDGAPSSATTMNFWMPFAGGLGDHEITVGLPGDVSNAVTFNVTTTATSFEPDGPASAHPTGGIPFTAVGYTDAGDLDDFYGFTLTEETSIDVTMGFTGSDDDLWVVDAAFTTGFCTSLTSANPESTPNCVLGAGDYAVWVQNYTGAQSTHRVDAIFTPAED